MKDVNTARFQNVAFGSSRRQIEEAEGYPPLQSEQKGNQEDLVYVATLAGREFISIYSLVNDAFAFGQHILSEDIEEPPGYVDAYDDVRTHLVESYGEPSEEEVVDSVDEMERLNVYGDAVWDGDQQQIRLQCFQDDRWTLQVVYEDKTLSPLQE